MAAEPMTPIQIMTISDGITVTPMTNSRMVRPREMRAMNPATNGENAITQHQMKTVHQPFQLSCQLSSGAAVMETSVQKLMGMKLVMKEPKVCERFEMLNKVGPKTKTAITRMMLRIEFVSLMRRIPLLIPKKAEMAVKLPRAMMTAGHINGLEAIPVKEVTPELNCMAAKPNDVANPRTVAMMASSSTMTPAPRWAQRGRMSTVASRNVSVLPRLWCE